MAKGFTAIADPGGWAAAKNVERIRRHLVVSGVLSRPWQTKWFYAATLSAEHLIKAMH
jgi:hypothetical protein